MTLNLQDVASAIGAAAHPPPLAVAGWTVDTRTQNPGDVYFALRGPNHDGHNFLSAAIEKGAAAVVVGQGSRPVGMGVPPAKLHEKLDALGGACFSLPVGRQAGQACFFDPVYPSEARPPPCELVVPDTGRALQALASWARHKWGGTVIGVTGSAGKTTTKDAIAHLLETEL